jgi:putative membrane protein
MLWLKAFHVVFVIAWFAGIFYLPRLFVYHAEADEAADERLRERLIVMERRLFGMMTFGASFALLFGIAMIVTAPGFLEFGWMHAKLTLVAGLIVYHLWCYGLMLDFRRGRNRHSSRWYRLFNEAPLLLLIAIVVLVVVKPF